MSFRILRSCILIINIKLVILLLLLLFLSQSFASEIPDQSIVQHNLHVVLYIEDHRIKVRDSITLPKGKYKEMHFLLHKGLKPVSPTPEVSIIKKNIESESVQFDSFKIKLPQNKDTIIIEYGGIISHPHKLYGKKHARGFKQTTGIISDEGVYLAGSSYWYPIFEDKLVTFNLQVELPPGWDAVSQGERTLHAQREDATFVRWESPEPQDGIFIIAAKFNEYTKSIDRFTSMVFLRNPDENLARKYLNATMRYVKMYEKLIGTYPYKKFALVENFWETGYGMPSFTLLGQKVIRLPFILNSSYPHEILHNWWGNSVFPDPMHGNWSEGLTAYLSDHLIKEQHGRGVEYRMETLQKYTDYVKRKNDFPLANFRSRHSPPSEAVGYGKALMFFHMLRRELGDKVFVKGLQRFYQENKFRYASFEDIRKSFEDVSGKDLRLLFDQWITQTGAPEIKISRTTITKKGSNYLLTVLIEQVQKGDTYILRIPVAVTMAGKKQAFQTDVVINEKINEFKLLLPARPVRVDVDPEFDVFRRLDREEMPPALTQTFGTKKMLILLPSSAGNEMLHAYRSLSHSLSQSGPDEVQIKLDTEIEKLPSDYTIILLGWENFFFTEMESALTVYDINISQDSVRIGNAMIDKSVHSVVINARHTQNKDLSITWIASDTPEALNGLGRKLPHYHKYSYLGFKGDEPINVLKGRWEIIDSPMTFFFPYEDATVSRVKRGEILPRNALIKLTPLFSKDKMMETIRFLSRDELKGRGLGTDGIDRTAEFISRKFKDAGLQPAGNTEGSYYQTWSDKCCNPEKTVLMKNVIGVIPGKKSEFSMQSIVIGAHYDHLGTGWPEVREEKNRGKIHNGADDNASGVAALIELAETLANNLNPDRTVIFVAFTGEESGKRGSKHYVKRQKRYPIDKCIAMINLDSVGRLEKRKLLVLGAQSAREWIHILRGAGFVTGVDIDVVQEELDSSDQKSFQEAGVPSIQLFSGPHLDYHRPTDTADKIDPEGLMKVAYVAKEVIEYLASREDQLTIVSRQEENTELLKNKTRQVTLGIIPDFTFSGKGCKLSGVVPGSPAESCGLREGDIIIKINSMAIDSLRSLSDILKSLRPGERISITFLREGKELELKTDVVKK